MDMGRLNVGRDAEFEGYEFGAGVTVEDFSGWETSGLESSRPVFVRCDEDKEDAPTQMLRFVVLESASGGVISAEAMDSKGQVWGHRMGTAGS